MLAHSVRQNTVRQRLGPLTLERFARIFILTGKIQCGRILSHCGPQSLSSETLADAFYTAKYSAAAPVALLSHWGPHSLCSEMLIFAFHTAKYSAAASAALGPPRPRAKGQILYVNPLLRNGSGWRFLANFATRRFSLEREGPRAEVGPKGPKSWTNE